MRFLQKSKRGNAKAIDETDVKKFLSLAGDNGFGKIVAHAPYTMNCCAAKEVAAGICQKHYGR